jgi:hypothetical protein
MKTSSVSKSANQQFFLTKKQIVILLNKSCQQFSSKSVSCQEIVSAFYPVSKFFCRCQQHVYSTDISQFLLARQSMEDPAIHTSESICYQVHYRCCELSYVGAFKLSVKAHRGSLISPSPISTTPNEDSMNNDSRCICNNVIQEQR